MRTHIVAGNWKMNKTISETEELVSELKDKITQIHEFGEETSHSTI